MGGGCQGNKADAPYAHAVPPSLNAGAMSVLVQRAYFSAWRMVCEVPSAMSAGMRALALRIGRGRTCVKSFSADQGIAGVTRRAQVTPSIVTTPPGSTLESEGQRKIDTGWL